MNEIKKSTKWKWWEKLLVVVIIILAIILLVSLPIFSFRFIAPQSDSMSPVFNIGDAILVVQKNDIKIGDIVYFKTNIDGELKITHRVIEIKADGELVTKGDANKNEDMWPNGWKLTKENVLGTYSSFKIPLLGYLVSLFHGNTGAYLNDTKEVGLNIEAATWEVPSPPNEESPPMEKSPAGLQSPLFEEPPLNEESPPELETPDQPIVPSPMAPVEP